MRVQVARRGSYTVQPVFKDHPWEYYNLVFVHRWSSITGSFMQGLSSWKFTSVVDIDKKLLNKDGL